MNNPQKPVIINHDEKTTQIVLVEENYNFLSFSLLLSHFLSFSVKPVLAAQTYDMASSSSYNIRFDGAAANNLLATGAVEMADLDGNGKQDLILGAPYADFNSRTNSGSLYIIYDSILDDYSGTGNNIDLSISTNYNLRIDGAGINASEYFSDRTLVVADMDNNGKPDIVAGALRADNNSRTDSGSLYIIYDSILDDYAGTGNNIDLRISSKYSLRYDGATAGDNFGYGVRAADADSDGKNDLLVGANMADNNSRNMSGSLYVIYSTLIDDYSGTGNNIDLATASNYNLRYDGALAEDRVSSFGSGFWSTDLNNNGRQDVLIGAMGTDNNSRNQAGSLYIVYDSLIDDYSGTGNNIDLATAANYNLRYDGAGVFDTVGYDCDLSMTGDFDNNGKEDIFIDAMQASNNSRGNSGSLYLIYDSLIDDYSGTGNNIDLATAANYNLRYDGAETSGNLAYRIFGAGDFDGDGKDDILVGARNTDNNSRTDSGSLYVIFNSLFSRYSGTGNNLDMATSTNYNLRYDGAAATDYFGYGSLTLADFNNDGRNDLLVGANYTDYNSRADAGSLYVIYNFPHTVSATALSSSYTTSDSLNVSGAVAVSANSTTSMSGVQYSLDSNTASGSNWHACTGTSSFTCNLSSLSEGGHTVYLRAYDTNTSYTAASAYSSASFTYDKTAPLTFWTNNEGATRTFSTSQANVFSTGLHLPSFSFTKAKDITAGISKYQILIKKEKQPDGSGNEYYTYIDDISHDLSGAGAGTILDETNRYIKYTGDDIFVYSKRTQDQLANGGYKWKVRVLDKAGNSTDTEEKILLINTHSVNFSGTWFPLVLLSKSPSFYGITTVNSIVILTLKQNNLTVFTKQTTANPQSRFGINLTKQDNLKSGTYTVLLSATNQHLDYIELPEFKYTYGKKTLPTVTAAKTSPSPSITEGLRASPPSEPEPTSQPTPEPTPTPKTKRCLFFWCW